MYEQNSGGGMEATIYRGGNTKIIATVYLCR